MSLQKRLGLWDASAIALARDNKPACQCLLAGRAGRVSKGNSRGRGDVYPVLGLTPTTIRCVLSIQEGHDRVYRFNLDSYKTTGTCMSERFYAGKQTNLGSGRMNGAIASLRTEFAPYAQAARPPPMLGARLWLCYGSSSDQTKWVP